MVDFPAASPEGVIGSLALADPYGALEATQKLAGAEEIRILRDAPVHSFLRGTWTNIKHRERQRYLLNAYRVLPTRARQGMAIFVPPGDPADATRLPRFYDETFGYLRDVGVPVL